MKNLVNYILESINQERITLNDISKLDFSNVSNKSELIKILKASKPDKDNNTGFWLFSEALEKDERAYGNINKEPWFINYIKCEATYKKDNKNNKNICGLISYSFKYWEDNDDKPVDGNIMHIFDVQTLSTFKGLLSKYFEKIEEVAKSNKCKGLTLKCYEKTLANVYKKYGFKPVKGQNNLMLKEI